MFVNRAGGTHTTLRNNSHITLTPCSKKTLTVCLTVGQFLEWDLNSATVSSTMEQSGALTV